MTETNDPVVPYANPYTENPAGTAVQPWWIGSLICTFIVCTSHYGMLEILGKAAYVTTFGFLCLGIYFGVLGIWKGANQLMQSLIGISLNVMLLATAVWMLIRK